MDTKQIRELTNEEIDAEIERARAELANLRFRASYEELENPSLLRTLRKEIARLLTIRRERELQSRGEVDG